MTGPSLSSGQRPGGPFGRLIQRLMARDKILTKNCPGPTGIRRSAA